MELMRATVSHRKYGMGTVTGFDGRVVTVFFDQYGAHSFRFPEIFAEDLKATDPVLQQQIHVQIEETASE